MEEDAVETMFDTSSEYMVLSMLENEMEVLRREEKNIDVSELPEYVTRYPELYAPKTENTGTAEEMGGEGEKDGGVRDQDTSGSLSFDGEQEVNQKIAYLTFDDGPSEQTAIVLDILKEEGIHAT
ncbi:MAG: polysaccharide deacetylase family protein, partial [Lachnospiraceae bacterium]|nr:polysaccharide deacetylase family protein [Lachnospiraceae bacterium]